MEGPLRIVIEFLAVAELSQAILLIFILLVMEKNRRANLFFAGFLLILSLNFFLVYIVNLGIDHLTAVFAFLAIPGISLLGVLIYFYAMFVTGLIDRFRRRQIIHFIPYMIFVVIFPAALFNVSGDPHQSKPLITTMFTMISLGMFSSIAYIFYTIFLLKGYYRRIENYYSDLERMSLNWLKLLTFLSFISLLTWCTGFWLSLLHVFPRNPVLMAGNILLLIVIDFITAYHLINQGEIFRRNIEMNHEIGEGDAASVAGKYARQSIDDRMQDEYLARLRMFMEEDKPYLDENISIKDLSEDTGIPAHHLSIVINNRLNMNFYNFINSYRIAEALSILDGPESDSASILAIAFRAGFNSKSTFNSVFKKSTGCTPSEYRKRHDNRSDLPS